MGESFGKGIVTQCFLSLAQSAMGTIGIDLMGGRACSGIVS